MRAGDPMRLTKIALGLAIGLIALPGVAEEIIYFTSGQTMAIRSHVVTDEGMVRVDLGSNNMMELPQVTIDRIETAGKYVMVNRSYGAAANQQVPSASGSFPVQGIRRDIDMKEVPMHGVYESPTPVTTDPKTGLAGYAPMGHRGPARQKLRVNGNMRVFSQSPTRQGSGETFTGTTQVGSRHVIGNVVPKRAKNPNYPEMVSLTMKGSRRGGGSSESSNKQDKAR